MPTSGPSAPPSRPVFNPDARVTHHFQATMRGSRAHGRGSAWLYRKWPELSPTFFPGPMAVLVLLVMSGFFPPLVIAALGLPSRPYPHARRSVITHRRWSYVADAYVQLAQETCEDIGFLEGLWRFRYITLEPVTQPHLGANGRPRQKGLP